MNKKFQITDKFSGKVKNVGELSDDGVFSKRVKSSKHYFRKADAYGIDVEVFDKLGQIGCKKIVILDSDKKEEWETKFETFNAKGWIFSFPGYGMQKFLEKKWWTIIDASGKMSQGGLRVISLPPARIINPQQTLAI